MEKSIHDLELVDFDNFTIWIIVDHNVGDGIDSLVEPIKEYTIDELNQHDYWVLIDCLMSDGTTFKGISLLKYYDNRLSNYSFYINNEWHSLFVKPAPDFVLEQDGPIPFCKRIKKDIKNVFPISISTDLKVENKIIKVINSIEI